MNRDYIRKAAQCFRTDEKTIEKFIYDFFTAPEILSAEKIMNDFVDAHEVDPELLYDFIEYLKK